MNRGSRDLELLVFPLSSNVSSEGLFLLLELGPPLLSWSMSLFLVPWPTSSTALVVVVKPPSLFSFDTSMSPADRRFPSFRFSAASQSCALALLASSFSRALLPSTRRPLAPEASRAAAAAACLANQHPHSSLRTHEPDGSATAPSKTVSASIQQTNLRLAATPRTPPNRPTMHPHCLP